MDANRKVRDAALIFAEWLETPDNLVNGEVQEAIDDLIRRKVGEVLKAQGVEAELDPGVIVNDLVTTWAVEAKKEPVLRTVFSEGVLKILSDEEPKEATRWLWAWGEGEHRTEEVEEGLFRALDYELRRLINRRLQTFPGLRHKFDAGDLVSELYLKLTKSNIPRLPENRKQFFGLADRVVQRTLLDLLKAKARRPQTTHPTFFEQPDDRAGQNQLQAILDAETDEERIRKKQRLEELVETLPKAQQDVFRYRRSGCTIAQVADMTGLSPATVNRYYSTAIAYLARAMRS